MSGIEMTSPEFGSAAAGFAVVSGEKVFRTSAYIWLNKHQDRATRRRPRLRRLITFARPRIGVSDFAEKFNAAIGSCYRVVNFLDIVALLPPVP
jgi:predicted lipase